MGVVRRAGKALLYRSACSRRLWFLYRFIRHNGYIPSFRNPKTYNEKVNFRKNDPKNPLFSVCSDKIRAKEYVAEKVSPDIIIPNYYMGGSITLVKVKEILEKYGDCFLKASHNSGPVHLLTTRSTDDEISAAIESTLSQLKVDFGKLQNEPWYSEIEPRVLVEKRLQPKLGEMDIPDYKFHVFKQLNGGYKLLCAVDLDRSTNHTRSFFDEDFNWLNLMAYKPNIKTVVEKPRNYELMCSMAKQLAEPFSYVRVDFYNVNGQVYFGELTFAPGSGFMSSLQSRDHDLWLGNLWQLDPRK